MTYKVKTFVPTKIFFIIHFQNGQHEFEVVDFVESDSEAKAAEVDDKSKIELNFPENNSEGLFFILFFCHTYSTHTYT